MNSATFDQMPIAIYKVPLSAACLLALLTVLPLHGQAPTKPRFEHLIEGRLDTLTSSTLQESLEGLINSGQHQILIDCTELQFISSSGLQVLLSAAKQLNSLQGKIALCALSIVSSITFHFGGIFLPRASFPKQLYSTLYACFDALPEPKICSPKWNVIDDTMLKDRIRAVFDIAGFTMLFSMFANEQWFVMFQAAILPNSNSAL